MQDLCGPEYYRLFIAIQLPEHLKTGIEKAQSELRRAVSEGCARWTTRQQFHLTLKFLGDVEAPRVGALAEAVRNACLGFPPLQLRARQVGFFLDRHFPRVAWVGVGDQPGQLPRLQAAVDAASRDFTAEAPEKNFTGHITLARVKGIRRHESEALAKAASGMAERFFGEWTADLVEIMRSELLPAGARHSSVAAIRLG